MTLNPCTSATTTSKSSAFNNQTQKARTRFPVLACFFVDFGLNGLYGPGGRGAFIQTKGRVQIN